MTSRIEFDDLVLVDVATAAEELGGEPARLKELIRSGKVAAVMHGGRWLIAEEEIERVRTLTTEGGDLLAPRPNKRRFLPPPRDADQLPLF
ncbi:hypothetical protein GCM10010464_59060 [Pseudonocardia yunnanensis]|uniref:Helix-turn-helix domain-containing protein n=1 Tax=Pseudonocardia yunnanensis TaxID=58107 RepID=A0ABW4ERY3_9PSEU